MTEPNATPRCAICLYWERGRYGGVMHNGQSNCRRRAPVFVPPYTLISGPHEIRMGEHTVFPLTAGAQLCGEFEQAAPDPEADSISPVHPDNLPPAAPTVLNSWERTPGALDELRAKPRPLSCARRALGSSRTVCTCLLAQDCPWGPLEPEADARP